jgi:hypothetical protein
MGRSSGVQVLLEISIEVLVGAQRQEAESSAFLDQVTDQVELLVMGELVNAHPRERPFFWLTARYPTHTALPIPPWPLPSPPADPG